MYYEEFKPATPLRPLIKAYIAFSNQLPHSDRSLLKTNTALDQCLGFIYPQGHQATENYILKKNQLPSNLLWPEALRIKSRIQNQPADYFFISFHSGQYLWLHPFSILDFFHDAPAMKEKSQRPLSTYYQQMMATNEAEERVNVSDAHFLKCLDYMNEKKGTTQTIIKLIQSDLRFNIKSVSKQLKMTDRHFRRLFHADMQVSPKKYQTLVRICKTINLLHKQKGEKMAAIAQECGFFDQSHFTNTFKSVIGITPSAYLKKLNKIRMAESIKIKTYTYDKI